MINKRLLLISSAALLGFIILVILVSYGLRDDTTTIKPQSKDSVKVDPITGETLIETEGIESEGPRGASLLGADNIQPLYGDDDVFQAVRDVLVGQFNKAQYVKISPKNINKDAVNNPGAAGNYLLVEFDVYLDKDTVNKYRISSRSQPDGLIYITITSPTGVVEKLDTSIYASDGS